MTPRPAPRRGSPRPAKATVGRSGYTDAELGRLLDAPPAGDRPRLNLTARQVALLGTMSDPDAARELGTTAYAIRAERRARGIAPFRAGGVREGAGRPPAAGVKQTERLGLTMTEAEMAEIVAAVPEGATLGRWVVEAALMRARAQEAAGAPVAAASASDLEDQIAAGHEVLDRTPSDPPTVRAVVGSLLGDR